MSSETDLSHNQLEYSNEKSSVSKVEDEIDKIIFSLLCDENERIEQEQENAALCDEVAKIQESILIVKDERKFLFRKVMEYENETDVPQSTRSLPPITQNGANIKVKKRRSPDTTAKNLPIT